MVRVCPLKDARCPNGMDCEEPCAKDRYYIPPAPAPIKGVGTPTPDEVYRAALKWCGEKGRETFLDDIRYFQGQWPYLPGLTAYVDREVAGREALSNGK